MVTFKWIVDLEQVATPTVRERSIQWMVFLEFSVDMRLLTKWLTWQQLENRKKNKNKNKNKNKGSLTNNYNRFKYPLAVVNQLLADTGSDGQSADNCPNINLMYDIVCKLEPSLKVRTLSFHSNVLDMIYLAIYLILCFF
jgi:hypothetical protein